MQRELSAGEAERLNLTPKYGTQFPDGYRRLVNR